MNPLKLMHLHSLRAAWRSAIIPCSHHFGSIDRSSRHLPNLARKAIISPPARRSSTLSRDDNGDATPLEPRPRTVEPSSPQDAAPSFRRVSQSSRGPLRWQWIIKSMRKKEIRERVEALMCVAYGSDWRAHIEINGNKDLVLQAQEQFDWDLKLCKGGWNEYMQNRYGKNKYGEPAWRDVAEEELQRNREKVNKKRRAYVQDMLTKHGPEWTQHLEVEVKDWMHLWTHRIQNDPQYGVEQTPQAAEKDSQ